MFCNLKKVEDRKLNYELLQQYGLSLGLIQKEQLNSAEIGRIVTQNRGRYLLQTESNMIDAEVSGKFMYQATSDSSYPQIGDFVEFTRFDESLAIINKVYPRTTELSRKASGKTFETQMIATNIDTVFICMGLDLDYNLRRMERYLGIVWNSHAMPVVVLTKSDMAQDALIKKAEVQRLAIGAEVIMVSNVTEQGFREIIPYLIPKKTIAFIGSSGVGKSTLINFIMGEETMKTGSVRHDSRGRHTTTSRELYLSPLGCIVIDTPGMREIQIQEADLELTFSDIDDLSNDCKYRDCTHTVEPGCRVLLAVEEGKLESARLKNYHKMQRELLRISAIKRSKKA